MDVAGQREPGPFRRVALKYRTIFIFGTGPDDVQTKTGQFFRMLADIIGLAGLVAAMIEGGQLDETAPVIEVADQQVQRVPGQHVVIAAGMLGYAAVDVDHRFFAVAGELSTPMIKCKKNGD